MPITVCFESLFQALPPLHFKQNLSTERWNFWHWRKFYGYNFFMVISSVLDVIIKNEVNGAPLKRTSNAPLIFYYFI